MSGLGRRWGGKLASGGEGRRGGIEGEEKEGRRGGGEKGRRKGGEKKGRGR